MHSRLILGCSISAPSPIDLFIGEKVSKGLEFVAFANKWCGVDWPFIRWCQSFQKCRPLAEFCSRLCDGGGCGMCTHPLPTLQNISCFSHLKMPSAFESWHELIHLSGVALVCQLRLVLSKKGSSFSDVQRFLAALPNYDDRHWR